MSFMSPRKAVEEGWIFTPDGQEKFNSIKQIQQAGIDLRVATFSRLLPHGINEMPDYAYPLNETPIAHIGINKKRLPSYQQIKPIDGVYGVHGNYKLPPGAYAVDFIEHVKVPANCLALVIHRSTLNRSGVILTGSIFDPGFSGQIGCSMYVHYTVTIEPTARLAQIIFLDGEAASQYMGAYKDKTHAETSSVEIG